MKRIAAISLAALLAAPSWGQHGGGAGHAGGGFAHAGGGVTASHSFSSPARSASPGSYHPLGSVPAYRPNAINQEGRFQYSSPTGSAPFGGTYPYGERRRGGQRGDSYRPYYSRGVYLVPGWLNYGYGLDYGYSDDSGDPQHAPGGDANAVAAPDQYADAGNPPFYGPPARPAYQPEVQASPDLQEQPEIILMFKDGRSPQQIQNYAVTRTTLYVLDGARRREIPLDQIDLPLTEKTNRDAGIDFAIPAVND
jgi:hypothetical protein